MLLLLFNNGFASVVNTILFASNAVLGLEKLLHRLLLLYVECFEDDGGLCSLCDVIEYSFSIFGIFILLLLLLLLLLVLLLLLLLR